MKAGTTLAEVLPAEALSGDPDPTAGLDLGRAPEAVVRPESVDEVAATLRWASAEGFGVLPVASGRRARTRALDRPFVLLRTDRLTGVEIYEPADLTLTARAGTSLAELAGQLGAHRQWLPFDPPRVDEWSLGGLTASGESGPAWMGYGELRNHVLGMTVVTGDGRTLRLGGRVVKNVAGFDLLKPMVGSRGRLAVITSVCVRAFPVPAEDRLLVVRGSSPRALVEVARAVRTAPVLPVSSVLVAPASAVGADAALLVRLHGALPTVEADQRTLERHCAVAFERAPDAATLWAAARDAASEAPYAVVSVLPGRLDDALAAVSDTLDGRGLDRELAADTYMARIRVGLGGADVAAASMLRAAIARLGGSLSVHAASGAGQGARAWTDAVSPPPEAEAELVEGLVRAFDPTGVLWPCRP
jgi:glycolate oxidase FAD binding subunit